MDGRSADAPWKTRNRCQEVDDGCVNRWDHFQHPGSNARQSYLSGLHEDQKRKTTSCAQAPTWLTRRMKLLNCSEGSLSGLSKKVVIMNERPASGRATTSLWWQTSRCAALEKATP